MKKILYRYNPETDNFERIFMTPELRLIKGVKFFGASLLMGGLLYVATFFWLGNPTEKALRQENYRLRTQYSGMQQRLDNSLEVMEKIQNRDDNFYRVMLQMDPVASSKRYAGLTDGMAVQSLSDESLITSVTRQLDLLDRQLYAQSLSFDKLREAIEEHKDKISHIPSVLPINRNQFVLSSGYGNRRGRVSGNRIFHSGLDLAASEGTPVVATADGIVKYADWRSASGNFILIDHDYNYASSYAHLQKIRIKKGDKVKRGEVIGYVGSTGRSSAPHLHYEVLFKDEPQNPVNYYFMDLTPDEYAEMIQTAEDAGQTLE